MWARAWAWACARAWAWACARVCVGGLECAGVCAEVAQLVMHLLHGLLLRERRGRGGRRERGRERE